MISGGKSPGFASLLCLALSACGGGKKPGAATDAGPKQLEPAAHADAAPGLPAEGTPLGTPGVASAGDAGPLPDRVYFRTNTESFNRTYYFATRGGDIAFAPNAETTGAAGAWQTMVLPATIAGRILEISADDDVLIALTVDRQIWTMTGALTGPAAFSWSVLWGLPFWTGPGQSLPAGILRWDWSVISPAEDGYWIDPAGNHVAVGAGKVSHIWILPADQSRLTFIDPWLPLDFSYGLCGPLRDRFRAENLTTSGSTIFVVNRYGDMFTRLWDFDMSGADAAFYKYSYDDQRGAAGTPPIQLPAADWVQHPKIDGAITNLISIHKTGQGAVHRVMRVEGTSAAGATGYFEKDVTELDATAWAFHETGRAIRGVPLDNRKGDTSGENLGESRDIGFSRNMDRLDAVGAAAHVTSVDDWAAELPSFNVYCTPAALRVHLSATESLDLVLHTVDTVRGAARSAGLDATPRDFTTAIEVPAAILAQLPTLSPKAQEFVHQYLGANRFTVVAAYATTDEFDICLSGPTFDRSCAVPLWKLPRAP